MLSNCKVELTMMYVVSFSCNYCACEFLRVLVRSLWPTEVSLQVVVDLDYGMHNVL